MFLGSRHSTFSRSSNKRRSKTATLDSDLQVFGLEIGQYVGDYILTSVRQLEPDSTRYQLCFAPIFGSGSSQNTLCPALYQTLQEINTDRVFEALELNGDPYCFDCYLVQDVVRQKIHYQTVDLNPRNSTWLCCV